MQGRGGQGGKGLWLSIPSSEMTTISPFSTSLTKRAPMMSSAQVSEARMVGVAELAYDQRPDAQRIADADEFLHRQQCERVGAIDPHQRIDQPHGEATLALGAARDQVNDYLGIGGRLEDRARGNQLAPKCQRIGQVAIMAERQAAHVDIGEERLHIPERGFAHRGVADMADGRRAR